MGIQVSRKPIFKDYVFDTSKLPHFATQDMLDRVASVRYRYTKHDGTVEYFATKEEAEAAYDNYIANTPDAKLNLVRNEINDLAATKMILKSRLKELYEWKAKFFRYYMSPFDNIGAFAALDNKFGFANGHYIPDTLTKDDATTLCNVLFRMREKDLINDLTEFRNQIKKATKKLEALKEEYGDGK